jgi:serine/threonine-protein kinase
MCPELLPQVRAGWQRLRVLKAELGALFPPSPVPDGMAPPLLPTADLPRIRGYEVQEVLGHGGVGVVYKAWHLRLNRAVALKMLLAGPYAPPEELERFWREAEAVAGLRHTNIVPVYDVGDLDGRPYFTMEYVEGGSLAQKLAGTPQPASQAAALVATLAQAIQFAHHSGIIHRDLKPANILLTADGIPKVTDFGLARRLERGGGLTLTGVPLGTPSYMAPEQGQGQWDSVGPATDVYALGAVLYELLTGRPPFWAETAAATLQLVLTEEPVPPSRLNPRVPRHLETICLKCLHKEPPRRYASAQALAEDLQRYGRGEPIAAHPAGRGERLARWVWRHPATAGLVAALMVLVAATSTGGLLLYQQQFAARTRQADTDQKFRAILERERDRLEEGWLAQDLAKLTEARDGAIRATDLARSGGVSAVVQRQAEAFREDAALRLERAKKNRALMEAVLDVSAPQEAWTASNQHGGIRLVLTQPSTDDQYADAFRRWGLDLDTTAEAEVVARIGAEPIPVLQEVIAALDGWMLERRQRTRPETDWRRLFRVAEQLDRSEHHRRLRVVLVGGSPLRAPIVAGLVGLGSPWPTLWEVTRGSAWRELLAVQKDIDPRTAPAQTVVLLAEAYATVGDTTAAEKLLRQATTARPDQVVLLDALGKLLERQGPTRLPEAIEYYRAARGQRRQLGIALSKALVDARRVEEAEQVLQELEPQQSNNPAFQLNRGIAAYRRKKLAEAEAAWRKAITLRPEYAEAHYNLGILLANRHKHGEAEAAWRKAIAVKPDYPEAYANLAYALRAQGKEREAEAASRKAIELKPHSEAYNNLGNSLASHGKYGAAEAAYHKALALRRDLPEAHTNLAIILTRQQKYAEAEAACRKGIELNPDFAPLHNSLGYALMSQERLAEAEAAYRKALQLKPDLASAYYNLGRMLMQQSQFDKAALALKSACELYPASDPCREISRGLQQRCPRYASLDTRLPGILRGAEKPADAAEQFDLAELCVCKRHYAAAARFWRDAFTAEPKSAEEATRYDAACAAVLAGCGQGKDANKLDNQERALWRRQALDWLRQNLAWWSNALGKGDAQTNAQARQRLRHWKVDRDLVGIRTEDGLARLPDEERKQWERFWSDVDTLLRRVSQPE